MRRLDIARRAARNLNQAKARTLLTSLAIAVGAFTLTLSLAAGNGARQYADKLLKNNVDPQALFITKDDSLTSGQGGSTKLQEYSESSTAGYRPGSTVKLLNKDDVAKLEKRDDLTQVVPLYSLAPTYTQFEGNDKKYTAPLSYYDATLVSEASVGSVPKLGQQIADDRILVPEEFANDLSVAPRDLIDRKISITFTRATQSPTTEQIQRAFVAGGEEAVAELVKPQTKTFTYTVSAVLKKPALALVSIPRLLISPNAARVASEYSEGGSATAGQVAGVTALAKGDADATKRAIKNDYGFSVQTAKDVQGVLFTFVGILQGIVAGFAMLALIASVFGIINTQYISVLERTSQIGLMKALGMSRRDIAKLFRYEAAWIGFLGGAIGALAAVIAGVSLNPFITKQLSLGDGNYLLVFVGWQIAALLAALVIIGVAAGWLPARKAARLDPIEALRTE